MAVRSSCIYALDPGLELGSITVDCAFVSARDEVAFIGRVYAASHGQNLALAAEAAGRAIAKELAGG